MYQIYKLVKSDLLSKTVRDGYNLKDVDLVVLERIGGTLAGGLDWEYATEVEAREGVIKNKANLKNLDVVILPVISIDYEGEIRE